MREVSVPYGNLTTATMSRSTFFVLTAAALTAFSSASAQTLQSDDRALLDARVAALMTQADIPGLSVAIVRNGALWWSGAFGVRNAETRTPVDENTIFEAASLTKPVFAYAVLRLVDKGIVKLDAPIATTLSNDRMKHDARYERITPRMVLSHGTGLPNWGGARLDLSFDPGTGWGYSGEGFVWLAGAVEKMTGISTEALVRREVFEPLGMRHSTLVYSEALEANAADRHNTWGRVLRRQPPPPEERGRSNAAASLRTTAVDYARFLIAVMSGAGLTPETARQFLRAQNEARNATNFASRPAELRERIAWGLGLGLERAGEGSLRFWHWGDNGPGKAWVLGDASSRTAIVYFANTDNGLAITDAMTALALPGPHYAMQWLRYQQFDAPQRLAYRAIVRAATDNGAMAGARAWRERRDDSVGTTPIRLVIESAEALAAERRVAVADSLLREAALDYPDSVAVPLAHGDILLLAPDARSALTHFERAAKLAASDTVASRRVQWTREFLNALDRPVAVAQDDWQRFTGSYGPRRVMLENGRLFYQRQGNPRYTLRPLTSDTYLLEELPTFRLQFVVGADGSVTAVVGHYHDGRRDENARTGN